MSTFLEICQTLRAEADIPGDGTPSDTANQVGDLADCVRWVQQSHRDIQIANGGLWRWLHRDFTIQTVASTRSYAYTAAVDTLTAVAISRFNRWDLRLPRPDCPRIYLTSGGVAGERELVFLPYADYRRLFLFGPQNNQPPVYISIDDQDNIVLGPVPDAVYTVSGRYFRGPQVLATNSEVPEMPGQYHDLIWIRALEKYAYKNVSQESLSRFGADDRRLYRGLMSAQLPSINIGVPLA